MRYWPIKSNSVLLLFALASLCILIPTFIILKPLNPATRWKNEANLFDSEMLAASRQTHIGSVVMPKMINETAKAELGRASWRLLHTMAQRYPENPTRDEKETFKSFIYIFSRMYPCGECAAHFQSMLREFPPQTANRNTASLYLCMLHNRVNERLKKEEFDCSKLEGLYDCGCGDEEEKKAQDSILLDPVTGEKLVPG